jgi:hypothetical protein
MRILRGKSNLEVSSHGFALFVVGLILATFVGGAVRTLLASDRVHQRIVLELRNRFPKHEIKIGTSEVLLSRGIWPALGLKIAGVHFTQETCDRLSFVVDVPTAILPINLWSLRTGRVRLGELELLQGKMHFDYRPCEKTPPAQAEPNKYVTGGVLPPPPPPPEKSKWRPPRFDWKAWGKAVDGVALRDFSVTYEGKPDWKIQVQNAELDFTHEFDGRALVEVQKALAFGTLIHAVELEAVSDDSVLQWLVNSEFKEGRVVWKGSWDTNTHTAASSLDVNQFPLREVLTELYQMGLVQKELELKTTWINCSANWEGSFETPTESPIHVGFCKIEGAYGGVQFEKADLYPWQKDLLRDPVEIRVTSLQVQPIVEAMDRKVLPTVINKLGVWTGKVSYLNRDVWSFDGHLAGGEIVFSNQSIRGKQSVRSVRTQAEKAQGLVAVKIDEVQLADGEFQGLVEFNLNEDWRSGTFKAHIENLSFSSGIQSLLINGRWDKLKMSGEGTLQNGELSDWKGTLESPQVKGEGWSGEGIRVRSRYSPGLFALEGQIGRLEINNQWKYFPPIQERVLPGASRMAFKDVRSKVEVRQSGGEILAWTALDELTGRAWRGRGGWQRDRDLVAVVSGTVLGKPKNFSIRAEKGLLMVDEQSAAAR